MYERAGFIRQKELPPDYRYVVGDERVHKFNFRHARLQTKLQNYDPELSEVENCHNHGLFRIFDCGLIRFVMENKDENVN